MGRAPHPDPLASNHPANRRRTRGRRGSGCGAPSTYERHVNLRRTRRRRHEACTAVGKLAYGPRNRDRCAHQSAARSRLVGRSGIVGVPGAANYHVKRQVAEETTGKHPDRPSPRPTARREKNHVRAIHRASPSGRCPGSRRSADAQAQLHRYRAHPARAAARGGGSGGTRTRVARHHGRARARSGGPDRRFRRGGHLRPDPVHPAGQEGPGAGAARSAEPGPQLHRHRAHPARPGARERGRRRPDPARLRCGLREDPQRGHPDAFRSRQPPARRRRHGCGRRAAQGESKEVFQAAGPVRSQPDQAGRRVQARPGGRS